MSLTESDRAVSSPSPAAQIGAVDDASVRGSDGSLRRLFQPKAVAVVGASSNPSSLGYRVLDAVVHGGYSGAVFPVNRTATAVGGLRAYQSVLDLPVCPDLAIIAVPRDAVLSVVDECAARGVGGLVVISAGFAETDEEGRAAQQRLLEKVRSAGIRMIGPNCLGFFAYTAMGRLDATFVPVFPPAGRVAMSSDSGALGLIALSNAVRSGLGISQCVCVGNRADVSSNDLLEYWEDDDGTDVIVLYLESFGNPRRFARIARRVSRRKPIVAMKSGRTAVGSRAAGSHTAALAARDVAVEALFRQTGIIRAESTQELFDISIVLASQPLPAGRRVGIITNAGGPAVLCADACDAAGLTVPELSPAVRQLLQAFLPNTASMRNPVDMIASASAEQFGKTAQALLASGEIDALIAIYLEVGVTTADQALHAIHEGALRAKAQDTSDRVILFCQIPGNESTRIIQMEATKYPGFGYPEAAANALGKIAAHVDWRRQPLGVQPTFDNANVTAARATCVNAVKRSDECWLSAAATRQVLEAMRIPIVAGGVARDSDEAVALAESLGFPVAIKLASSRVVHKTEFGGVQLNLTDRDRVRRAVEEIRARLAAKDMLSDFEGVVVQSMINRGTEVMIGMTHDPLFGPLLALGLGGIHVEILGDVCFRVGPLTDRDAGEMVRSIRGYRLLTGYRGHPPADLPALEDALLRVSALVEAVPQIMELDLNPVFALEPGAGCLVADARIRVGPA